MKSNVFRLPFLPPATRGDCLPGGINAKRPCEATRCRHHLLEGLRGKRKVQQLAKMSHVDTCVLDVADRGGSTLQEVADILGITRQRVEQIQVDALAKLEKVTDHEHFDQPSGTYLMCDDDGEAEGVG